MNEDLENAVTVTSLPEPKKLNREEMLTWKLIQTEGANGQLKLALAQKELELLQDRANVWQAEVAAKYGCHMPIEWDSEGVIK